jgi:hypothetical protein
VESAWDRHSRGSVGGKQAVAAGGVSG